ncbi:MAG TPA: NAD(P)H-dependent oxidoreductase, partial [Candidatus Saccharimonadales bacterium]|nr:NAD(P)H-dependent oxidoreductase [Candidatus Saccharimonadales bacterium]
MKLTDKQEHYCATSKWDFSDLTALFLNCTLKRSPETSHTEGLIKISQAIMGKNRVATEVVRPIDFPIATGVYPDMREHGWEEDAWPKLQQKVMAADILVLCGPIWLGDNSSVMKQTIERLYANSSVLNQR